MENLEKKKILVVDDDIDLNRLICLLIEDMGYCVLKAYSGLTGVKIAKKEHPDLITMDLIMPQMDGFEAISKIQESVNLEWMPKIIIISARISKEVQKEVLLSGADSFLPKPFTRSQLYIEINQYLKK